MLRSIISNLSIWIQIFGLGQAKYNFVPCIRIISNIVQDPFINRKINQPFNFAERDDKPHIPRYISKDGDWEFIFNGGNQYQWFLIPAGSTPWSAYLKTTAPNEGPDSGPMWRDPLMIVDDAWRIYTNEKWQSVTNPIEVKTCENLQQQTEQSNQNPNTQVPDQTSQGSNQVTQSTNQVAQVSNPSPSPSQESLEHSHVDESSQSSSAQASSSTISPLTTSQPDSPASTVKITMESIPECIQINADLTFIENNNDEQITIDSILKV